MKPKRQLRVIVLEDDEHIQRALVRSFSYVRDVDLRVVNAFDVEQAIEAFLPDVVVCDVMLAGMEGPTFVRSVLSRLKMDRTRLALFSAADPGLLAQIAEQSGACEVFQKSGGFRQLRDWLIAESRVAEK